MDVFVYVLCVSDYECVCVCACHVCPSMGVCVCHVCPSMDVCVRAPRI